MLKGMAIQQRIIDGDDFHAMYTAEHFEVGIDEEHLMLPIAVVIKVTDVSEYQDAYGRPVNVDVNIAPCIVHEEAFRTLEQSMDLDRSLRDSHMAVAEAADGYGWHAPVIESVKDIKIEGVNPSFREVIESDDYDAIIEWVTAHGDKLASVVSMTAGFALDNTINRIGETGWDAIMGAAYADYRSKTEWPQRPALKSLSQQLLDGELPADEQAQILGGAADDGPGGGPGEL